MPEKAPDGAGARLPEGFSCGRFQNAASDAGYDHDQAFVHIGFASVSHADDLPPGNCHTLGMGYRRIDSQERYRHRILGRDAYHYFVFATERVTR